MKKEEKDSFRGWDEVALELLTDPEEARRFLVGAIEAFGEDGDQAAFLLCVRQVVEAQMGFAELSIKTGRSKQHLYEALSSQGNPRLDTLLAILRALGVLQMSPKREAA
jgi:probable addiction module antidote protein